MKEILAKALLQKIERLEAFEDRMKIRIENISMRIDDNNYFRIFCEVHPVSGTSISEHITLECVIYDTTGAISLVESANLYSDDFFGFEVIKFSITDSEVVDRIGKIRIYPKKR
jgi:hypothetical protein